MMSGLLSGILALVLVTGVAGAAVGADGLTLYVAPNGNDAWSGTRAKVGRGDGPFATLERARDAVRLLKKAGSLPAGGVTVEVAAGTYELARPLELGEEDSGTEAAPVAYRAKAGAEVRLVGGKQVTNFQPVTDPAVLRRLNEGARGKVMQADLKALGVTDFGDVAAGGRRLELFYDDRPMSISRWPNEGFVRIVDLVGGAPHKIHGIPGDKIGKFTYADDRPKRWAGEKDVWLHGYWFWDWSDQRQRVESIDTEKRVITLEPPYHTYGYRKNQWYYAFNLLPELDTPGEYHVDREAGILYFWPPAAAQNGGVGEREKGRRGARALSHSPKALVSILPALINTKNASHVTFRGFTLEATRSTAVNVEGGANVKVVACVIRNTGGWAVNVSGGSKHGVVGCDIYETAGGGIGLHGGDRKSLTPAGHYAENNHIHHYARWNRVYQPGITLQGVGNRASHNLIHDAPHMAMGFGGNDHVIEFNEMHSVCYESNDAGAVYTGRNWSMRGTVIRHNYLHHINGWEGRGCVGLYLDDQFSGTTMVGNLFYNVTRAAMIGGGRDCTIENNVFVDCNPATHVDARGLGWASGGAAGMKSGLEAMPYKSDLWAKRYPGIATTLDDDPMAPKGNVIARNICVGGRWGDFEGKAKPLVKFEDNLLDQDPLFVNAKNLDFRLKEDSPAWKLGFKRLPIEQMGLVKSADRASWPVQHTVRPMVTPPAPPEKAARKGAPAVFKVARAVASIAPGGTTNAAEWSGGDPATAMTIAQGLQGEKAGPPSMAWLSWDDTTLIVNIDNLVDPKQAVQRGNQWGQDDAVEIALRNTAAGKDAPVLVLRGFPSGHFESTDEAGAPAAAAKRAGQGVTYRARVVNKEHWVAQWRIPFASLGIDPAKHTRFAFNISVRKSAEPAWIEWQGTGGSTWEVDRAGVIELVR